MRIAVVNWSSRRVGGTETYLSDLIVQLYDLGHELAFFHEVEQPVNREQITLPDDIPTWCVAELGTNHALTRLRAWRPDLIFSHGLHDTRLEAEVLKIAPAILFAHTYYGTCISGEKTFKRPIVRPCQLRFGWKCLLHYYPHRCGGLSPITMLRLFRAQTHRLANVNEYKAIVTHSSYMRDEFIRQGFSPERIHNISYYSERSNIALQQMARQPDTPMHKTLPHEAIAGRNGEPPWHLLFLGRMSVLKGGQTLLAALSQVHEILKRPLHVTFAGDGPDRRKWEKQAARLQAEHKALTIEFVGWIKGAQIQTVFDQADLLVLPSLWPEPFGLIGLEAGHHGIPIAAFAVGGIPDWLFEGVNGHLAPGDPPTPQGLAETIVKCLQDPAAYARLRQGATEVADGFSMGNHLTTLLHTFEQVLRSSYAEVRR